MKAITDFITPTQKASIYSGDLGIILGHLVDYNTWDVHGSNATVRDFTEKLGAYIPTYALDAALNNEIQHLNYAGVGAILDNVSQSQYNGLTYFKATAGWQGVKIGTFWNDWIAGTDAAHDKIMGLGGNDTLYGGSGNDTLIDGSGWDTLSGSWG